MSNKTQKIQRVEIAHYELPLHCPFCGRKAYDQNPRVIQKLKPCKHALFIAHDEGFEYRSALFNRLMKIEKVSDNSVKLGRNGYDGFTDRVCCADSVKFAIYIPAPSFFGAYYGFAPCED